MKRKNFIILLLIIIIIATLFTLRTYALTENEIKAQAAASGKEEVAGNVFIWFLCAIAFLKIAKKIESLLGSIGLNVTSSGNSSMLGELMIAMKGMSLMKYFGGGKSIIHLSEAEVMAVTNFKRGNGLISTNNNNITVEFRASSIESQLITTDKNELREIVRNVKLKNI